MIHSNTTDRVKSVLGLVVNASLALFWMHRLCGLDSHTNLTPPFFANYNAVGSISMISYTESSGRHVSLRIIFS